MEGALLDSHHVGVIKPDAKLARLRRWSEWHKSVDQHARVLDWKRSLRWHVIVFLPGRERIKLFARMDRAADDGGYLFQRMKSRPVKVPTAIG